MLGGHNHYATTNESGWYLGVVTKEFCRMNDLEYGQLMSLYDVTKPYEGKMILFVSTRDNIEVANSVYDTFRNLDYLVDPVYDSETLKKLKHNYYFAIVFDLLDSNRVNDFTEELDYINRSKSNRDRPILGLGKQGQGNDEKECLDLPDIEMLAFPLKITKMSQVLNRLK